MRSIYFILMMSLLLVSCKESSKENRQHHSQEIEDEHMTSIELSLNQATELNLGIKPIEKQSLSTYVEVNGLIKVPPQNEAVVTGILAGNMVEITVNEGDLVQKNQVLGYLSHPDLVKLQTDYLKISTEANYFKREFERQKMLYEQGVAAGRVFQEAERNYQNAKEVKSGLEAQLQLIQLNPQQIKSGQIAQKIPVKSPIAGYIQKINIKTGQFIEPQTPMFEIINPKDIYAELRVFEKELKGIEMNQKVDLILNDAGHQPIPAKISAVGKAFSTEPKAVFVRAEIEDTSFPILPGTFVKAQISSNQTEHWVLPEDALVNMDNKMYIFSAEQIEGEWIFNPVEIQVEFTSAGKTAFRFMDQSPGSDSLFVHENAYYILAEAQKGEVGHEH